ncbi:hypothetical protein G3N59_27620 [Paraburkholderia sp. Ac-20340]|uniref:hypothetical protein n=1 Tax=Paraburkholderia sp. Ac-20340 TaxID=2703888 RepID=UPI001980EC7E|nr:hypothetical protein [Paraburkholderia sp. Ac-20340]MBN3857158.1 hypothetical protein [Paraburkholderia sp. Ac-20340]
MKRLYQHRGHAVDVSVEAQCPAWSTQDNPVTAPDYVAILTIYLNESHAQPLLGPLRIERMAGQVFASEVEALMGGFSEGRRLVDRLVESGEGHTQAIASDVESAAENSAA